MHIARLLLGMTHHLFIRIDVSKIKAGSLLLQVIDNNMHYNAKFVKN